MEDKTLFRKNEFPQLNETLYLDFAGSMPICQSQVKRYQYLSNLAISNPHSASQINQAVNEIAQLRSSLLSLMNTSPDDYLVIFSHNTTTAVQTLANLIKIDQSTNFTYNYLYDNHNSVIGIREIFSSRLQNSLKSHCISLDEIDNIESILKSDKNSLFAFPMVSNFNGKKYPYQKWTKLAQNSGSLVLLDAASTTCCDLSEAKPDFVVLSLLKLFGSHGGVLLVRRDRSDLFQDPPPAGGTLLYSCTHNNRYKFIPILSRRLEGGTSSYIDLMLALEGLKTRKKFGSEKRINDHLKELSELFYNKAKELKHSSGKSVIRFHQDTFEYPTFSFNIIKDTNGGDEFVNHNDAMFAFSAMKVVCRSGSHCNPGANFSELKWSPDEVVSFGEDPRLSNKCASSLCIVGGRPVATFRVSFGYPTIPEDIHKLVDILARLFVNGGPNPTPQKSEIVLPMRIEKIIVSPISGCNGYEVNESLFDKFGLLNDRRWILLDDDGNKISPPVCFGTASLTASIAEDGKVLRLNYNNMNSIDVAVNPEISDLNEKAPQAVKNYGKVYSNKVSQFFIDNLGIYAYLVKIDEKNMGKFPFSLITKESTAAAFPNFDDQRWHPNFVMSGAPAFSEEGRRKKAMKMGSDESGWRSITIWRWRVACMTSAVVPSEEYVESSEMNKLVNMRSNYGTTPFGVLFGADLDGCKNGQAKIAVGDYIAEDI